MTQSINNVKISTTCLGGMIMSEVIKKTLINQRLIAVLFMGFAAGLPLSLVGATLQAWYTQANISVVTVGALTLVGIPYTLKFLWAPLMDYPGFTRFGRRGWIVLAQLALAVLLYALSQMQPGSQAALMGVLALIIAFFSATQDIAIDAYRTDILEVSERGLGSAYYVATYRLAVLLSGGLGLVLADYIGWQSTYQWMSVLMLLSMIATYVAPREKLEVLTANGGLFEVVKTSLADLLKRDKLILLLLFIIFYKIGDALALSLMTNFLLHGLGFSLTEVGVAYKLVSFFATIAGAFVGGLLLIRWNIYRALMLFGMAQAFSNLMFVWLAIAGKVFTLMAASIFIENFCSGLSTAAFMAFLMSLCNKRYTAGQYALLSAVASLGRVFLGPVAGLIVKEIGWVQFYMFAFSLSFPGLFILILLKERVATYAPAVTN